MIQLDRFATANDSEYLLNINRSKQMQGPIKPRMGPGYLMCILAPLLNCPKNSTIFDELKYIM